MTALRMALAAIVILATNFWGMVITFSDSTSPSLVHWTAYVTASHLPGAFVTGALFYRKWWLGALVAMTATLMLILATALPSAAVLLLAAIASAYGGNRAVRAVRAARRR